MFLKNFFGERFEITCEIDPKSDQIDDEVVENALKRKYGDFKDCFRLFKVANQYFISFNIHNNKMRDVYNSNKNVNEIDGPSIIVPNELKELGVTQEDYEPLFKIYKSEDEVKVRLLPYTFKPKDEFNIEFDRSELNNIDNFINKLNDSDKSKIIKNYDKFIDLFFSESN